MNFPDYQVEAIDSATWLIKDQINSIVYLLEGETKALLLDTGSGVYKLRPVVEALTQKPVVVVNTHYHGDHTGANYEFDRMMISEEDRYYLEHPNDVCISTEFLRRLVPMVYGVEADAKDCRLFDEPRRTQFPPVAVLHPHDQIDLGNRVLEVLPIPGHTKGSIMLLEPGRGILYSGDSCCSTHGVLLHFEPECAVEDFRRGLEAIAARRGEFTRIYPGHHRYPLPVSYLEDFIACCRGIEDGSIVGVPSSRGEGVLEARFGQALVIYLPQRIHRAQLGR